MYRECLNCKNRLPRDATYRRKFCDARCRVQYSRKKKSTSGYHEAMVGITSLGNAQDSRNGAILCLKALREQIDHELRKLKDEESLEKYEMFAKRRARF